MEFDFQESKPSSKLDFQEDTAAPDTSPSLKRLADKSFMGRALDVSLGILETPADMLLNIPSGVESLGRRAIQYGKEAMSPEGVTLDTEERAKEAGSKTTIPQYHPFTETGKAGKELAGTVMDKGMEAAVKGPFGMIAEQFDNPEEKKQRQIITNINKMILEGVLTVEGGVAAAKAMKRKPVVDEPPPEKKVDTSKYNQTEFDFQEGPPIPKDVRSPYNLTPEQIAKAEQELNPATEQRVAGQGELFTPERAYAPDEIVAGRAPTLTEPQIGARDRQMDPESIRMQMDTPARVGEMETRVGPPYEAMGRSPDQGALPFETQVSDLGQVGLDRARRLAELAKEKPIPYTPVRGPGRNQMGAVGDLEKLLRPGETLAFHGTSKDAPFTNFKSGQRGNFFTRDADSASQYARENDSMGYKQDGWNLTPKNTASRVMPVALDLKKVYKLDEAEIAAYQRVENYAKYQREMAAKAKRQGFDAVEYPDGGIQVVNNKAIRSVFDQKRPIGPKSQRGVIDPDLLTLGVSRLLKEAGPRETIKKFAGTFKPSVLERAIEKSRSPTSKESLVWMKPEDFHNLANERYGYEDISPDLRKSIKTGLSSKEGLTELPYLLIDNNGKVLFHEGRHRMDVFRGQGMDLVPVNLISNSIKWGETPLSERPKRIIAQDQAYNPHLTVDMPSLLHDQLKQESILSKHRPMASQTGAVNFFQKKTEDSVAKKGIVRTMQDMKNMFTFDKRPLKQMLEEEHITPETMNDLAGQGTDLASRMDRLLQTATTNAAIDRQLAILSANKGPVGKVVKWVIDNQNAINQKAKLRIEEAIETGLKPWKALKKTNEKSLRDMLTTWQKSIGKDELTEANFTTPKQWEAYQAVNGQIKSLHERVNAAREKAGLKPIASLSNYFPAIREGDYWVRVLDSTGETKWASAYSTVREAQAAHKLITKEFGNEFQVQEPTLQKKGQYDLSSFAAFDETMKAMSKDDPVRAAIQKRYAELVGKRGFGKTGIMRKDVGGAMGFETGVKGVKNSEHVLEAYFKRGESYIANLERAQMQKQIGEVPSALWDKAPIVRKYIDDYLQKARGAQLDALPMIRNLTEAISTEVLGMGRQAPRKFIQNTASVASLFWLTTPKFLLSQLAQPLNAAAKLTDLYQLGDKVKNPVHAFYDGYAQSLSPDAISKEAKEYAKKNGYLDSTIVSLLEMKLHDLKGEKWRLVDDAARWSMGKIETQLVRAPVFHMFERTLREQIPNKAERFEMAANLMDNYMVHYDRESGPMMYEKAGLVGEMARPLKTYAHNAWGQFFEYAQTAKDTKNIVPLATMLGTQTLVGGLKGVILAAEATAIITAINAMFETDIPTPEQLLLQSDAPDALIYGGYSDMLGVDISSSMAAPGMPQMFSFPPAEFTVKAVGDSWNYLIKKINGTATDQDAMKAMLATTPAAMRGWIESLYSEEGQPIPKPNDKMKGNFPAPQEGTKESFFRFGLGLKSIDESKADAIVRATKQLLQREVEHKMSSLDAIVDRVSNGQELDEALIQKYMSEGGDMSNLSSNIVKRLRDRQMTFTDREQSKPITPNQANRLETLKKFLDSDFKEDLEKGQSDGKYLQARHKFSEESFGVLMNEYMGYNPEIANVTGDRRDYYVRSKQREGYPKPEIIAEDRGTNVLGRVKLDAPHRVMYDKKSHDMLQVQKDYTLAHEGSHQDMLYAGLKENIPPSKFYNKPASAGSKGALGTLYDELVPETKADKRFDNAVEKSLTSLSRKHDLASQHGGTEEVLAELKAYESSLKRGKDLRSTDMWKELVDGVAKRVTVDGEPTKRLKDGMWQWFLYNSSAPSIPNMQRTFDTDTPVKYAPEILK